MGKMKSAGKIQFNIPGILYEVKMSQIFLGMNSRELTSPGNLCNDRFMFELTKEKIDIKKTEIHHVRTQKPHNRLMEYATQLSQSI